MVKKKSEKHENVGKKALVKLGSILVEVIIVAYEPSYGRERYIIRPVAGEGTMKTERLSKIFETKTKK